MVIAVGMVVARTTTKNRYYQKPLGVGAARADPFFIL